MALSLALSKKIVERLLFSRRSPPGDRCVMSLALFPQVVSQAPQDLDFPRRERLLMAPFCLLAPLDSTFPGFLAEVSHREVGIGLGTFPTPWFACALSAGNIEYSA